MRCAAIVHGSATVAPAESARSSFLNDPAFPLTVQLSFLQWAILSGYVICLFSQKAVPLKWPEIIGYFCPLSQFSERFLTYFSAFLSRLQK
jgi:hypothetical protein